ncbi:MAG: hypothetical protein ACK4SM_00055 [Aquificaceae bacterium]
MRIPKNTLILVIFMFIVVLSYLLGILAFSSKEARDKKWEEFKKEYLNRK